jgi:hypothetical protein
VRCDLATVIVLSECAVGRLVKTTRCVFSLSGLMVYALVRKNPSTRTRRAIANAIAQSDSQALQPFIGNVIAHVMNTAAATEPLFCIYCQDQVHRTLARPPRGRTATNAWHFEHDRNARCLGEVNAAIGVLNPPRHGCYVALGCETVTGRNRGSCQTIDQGRTYCHLGGLSRCI